jgi:hypothetical protein
VSGVIKSKAKSKSVAVTTKKELRGLSRYEVEKRCRELAYQDQRETASALPKYITQKGDIKSPNATGLMVSFNAKVKKCLGYSCDEIDKIKDIFLCNSVRALRDEFIQICRGYVERWDGSVEMYDELKKVLRELPVIAKQNLDNKMTQIKEAAK